MAVFIARGRAEARPYGSQEIFRDSLLAVRLS